MNDSGHSFRARLRRRVHVWWGSQTPGIHGTDKCHELRMAGDDEGLWKCCPLWQRKLSNKWNAREFAVRHGVRVPHLFWSGRDVKAIPFDSLPDAYAIRLTSGSCGREVVVMRNGVNLLDGKAYTVGEIRDHFARLLAGAFSRTLMLVEEYVPPHGAAPDIGLPPNYRFHMFGDVLAFISVSCARASYTHRNTDWKPDPKRGFDESAEPFDWPRPPSLERMIDIARTLGEAYESYVRVDLYAAPGDPIFAEFAPNPGHAVHYSPEADAELGELWARHFPDAL